MKNIILSTILTAGMVGSLSAATVYEPFSQTIGSLGGQTGGTGTSGNWTTNGTVNVEAQDFTYGDLQNSGNQISVTSSGSTQAYVTTSSALGDAGLLDDGASLWFSFVYRADSNGGSNEKAGFAFGTDHLAPDFSGVLDLANAGNAVGMTVDNTTIRAATWNGTDPTEGGSFDFEVGDELFIVGRIDWGATGADDETITLYNPSLTALGTLGSAISTNTLVGVDQTLFDTISMAQRNSGGDQHYDEVRFGATYDDVSPIPEPAAALLGGLGGLLILRRRRA